MTFTSDGLIQQFLDVLGVQLLTASGHSIAFLAVSALFALCITSFMVLLFKFLVYIRKG